MYEVLSAANVPFRSRRRQLPSYSRGVGFLLYISNFFFPSPVAFSQLEGLAHMV